MKNIVVLLLFLSLNLFAQKKQIIRDSFNVKGVCIMCKNRIEKSVFKLKGVKYANWNIISQNLSIIFDSNKISLDRIHKEIAILGHDTSIKRALDEVYYNLPDCCLYERNNKDYLDR